MSRTDLFCIILFVLQFLIFLVLVVKVKGNWGKGNDSDDYTIPFEKFGEPITIEELVKATQTKGKYACKCGKRQIWANGERVY